MLLRYQPDKAAAAAHQWLGVWGRRLRSAWRSGFSSAAFRPDVAAAGHKLKAKKEATHALWTCTSYEALPARAPVGSSALQTAAHDSRSGHSKASIGLTHSTERLHMKQRPERSAAWIGGLRLLLVNLLAC